MPPFKLWFPYAKDAVIVIAALATAFAAVAGLKTWRDQLSGSDKRATARALLRAVRWFAKEIEQTRERPIYPTIPYVEAGRYMGLAAVSDMRQEDYGERLDDLRDPKKVLSDAEEDAAVLWGDRVHVDLKPLFHMSDILAETSKRLIQLEYRNKDTNALSDADQQEFEMCLSVLYRPRSGPDPFGIELEKVLRTLEPVYRKHL